MTKEAQTGKDTNCESVDQRVGRFFWNHSTASAKAWRGGVWGRPSSRMALAGLKNILYFAMRTPANGAFGGLPVIAEMASFDICRRESNAVRHAHFWRGHAGDFLQAQRMLLSSSNFLRRCREYSVRPAAFFGRQNMADCNVADMNPIQTGVEVRRHFAIQKIDNDLAGWRGFDIARSDRARWD